MKRTERQHLKENEIQLLTRQARDLMESRKRETAAAIVGVAVIAVLALGYYTWHQHVESRAHEMLAQAITVQEARAGQYDQAINTFKELAQRKDGPLPIDGILMHLGRTYLDAGKRAEAQQTFNRLVEEFPASPYTAEARQQLDSLKKT